MAIMEMIDYGFRYENEREYVIKNINFKIDAGKVILIAGDSGSGKSTFLKSLNGLIPHIVEGEVLGKRFLDGKDFDDMPIYEISSLIGSVFQNPRSQFFTLNSTSELVFAMENYGFSKKEMVERLSLLTKEIPIKNLMDRDILSLSSGERQLLALGSAMVLSPKILLLDEPSANLDYRNAMKLRVLIKRLKDLGKTVLIADHRFFYLNNIIDRVFLIEESSIKIYQSEEEFKNSHYNTRSFELFKMKIPFKKEDVSKVKFAELENVIKKQILEDISLSFYKDEITTIVGINGAGKTTLARLLTGSIKPDKGQIKTDEMPFYIMQDADYQLFGTSVLSEVSLSNKDLDEEKVEQVLKRLDIWKYKNSHPFDLSGGEKQRLQIAMAALSGKKILILDEPTSGLDVKSMFKTVTEIEEISKERAVIIISHDYEFIRKIAHRIIHIEKGRVKEDFYLNEETVEKLNNIFKEMEEIEDEEIKA